MPINLFAAEVIADALEHIAAARRLDAALDALGAALVIEAPPIIPIAHSCSHTLHQPATKHRCNVTPRSSSTQQEWVWLGEWDKGDPLPSSLDRTLFLHGLSLPRNVLSATVFQDGEGLYAVCRTHPHAEPVTYEAMLYPVRCDTYTLTAYRWVQAVTLVPRAALPPAA